MIERWVKGTYIDKKVFSWSSNPFKHIVLPNFFLEERLELLLEKSRTWTLERNYDISGSAAYSDVRWAGVDDPEFIQCIYSEDFLGILSKIVGQNIKKKRNFIPQYNRFPASSKGLQIHNDSNESLDFVTIIFLNDLPYECGGELILWRVQPHLITPEAVIHPTKNTMVILQISENSWHSVSPISGVVDRETITLDWVLKARSQV